MSCVGLTEGLTHGRTYRDYNRAQSGCRLIWGMSTHYPGETDLELWIVRTKDDGRSVLAWIPEALQASEKQDDQTKPNITIGI